MRSTELQLLPGGRVRLCSLPPLMAEFLRQVPEILDGASPFVDEEDQPPGSPEARLFPSVCEDRGSGADLDWKKCGRPDLVALFASRREIVEGDLAGMHEEYWVVPWLTRMRERVEAILALQEELGEGEEVDLDALPAHGPMPPAYPLFRIEIPKEHRTAWLSSLNATRLLLAERYGWMEEPMDRARDFDPEDPRDLAAFMMDALAEIAQLLIEAEDPPIGRQPVFWVEEEGSEGEDSDLFYEDEASDAADEDESQGPADEDEGPDGAAP